MREAKHIFDLVNVLRHWLAAMRERKRTPGEQDLLIRAINALEAAPAAPHKLKEEQQLYVRSMGKAIRVTHICTFDSQANHISAGEGDHAVVAEFGRYILLAKKYDKGITIPKDPQ